MKAATAVAVLLLTFPAATIAQVGVQGYVTKNGTYVAPHYRSAPNNSRYDNYSSKGNYNPYTGQQGSVDPYRMPSTQTYSAPRSSYYSAPEPRSSYGSYGGRQSTYGSGQRQSSSSFGSFENRGWQQQRDDND